MNNEDLELFKGVAAVYKIDADGVITRSEEKVTYCTLKHSCEFCRKAISIFETDVMLSYTNIAPGEVVNDKVWYPVDPGIDSARRAFRADCGSKITKKETELNRLQEIYEGL